MFQTHRPHLAAPAAANWEDGCPDARRRIGYNVWLQVRKSLTFNAYYYKGTAPRGDTERVWAGYDGPKMQQQSFGGKEMKKSSSNERSRGSESRNESSSSASHSRSGNSGKSRPNDPGNPDQPRDAEGRFTSKSKNK